MHLTINTIFSKVIVKISRLGERSLFCLENMQEDDRKKDRVKETELTTSSRKDVVSKSFHHRLRKGKGLSVLVKMCQNLGQDLPYRWYFLSHRIQSQKVTQGST